MKILGLDCGTKNLGFAVVEFEHMWKTKLEQVVQLRESGKLAEHAQSLLQLYKNLLQLKHAGKFDLLPNQKMRESTALERAARLKGVLTQMDSQFGPFDLVLVEYQMGPNNKAQDISSQIIMHYSTPDFNNTAIDVVANSKSTSGKQNNEQNNKTKLSTIKIKIVGPSLKNSIWIGADGEYINFIRKYNNTYTANKAHTVYNFETYCKLFDVQLAKIKKSDMRDAADAFMMILAKGFAFESTRSA